MKSFFKRTLHILSLGTFVFTSCNNNGNVAAMYGVPVDLDTLTLSTTVKAVTNDNLPIQGLSVKLINHQDTFETEYTNKDGFATFNFNIFIDSFSYLIEDVDGEKNLGNFKTKKINTTGFDTTNITLKPSDKL